MRWGDADFINYFRMNRIQLAEVHALIHHSIEIYECNVRQTLGTEKKLAIF